MTNPAIVAELKRLRDKNKLFPEVVVTTARELSSPLHNCFEWDDSAAAHQHRLWQARQLIANVRIFRDEEGERPIPVFVSLIKDRVKDGGYRTLEDVLSDPARRQELLETALMELKAFQERYALFKELAGVFGEIKKLDKHRRRERAA